MKTFSLLHATWGRPQKAAAAMRMALERAARPQDVEYILCADESDDTRFDLVRATRDAPGPGWSIFVEHPGTGSASAWDFAAKFSTGQILIQMQDDIEFPNNWDLDLACLAKLAATTARTWEEVPLVIAVNDGFRVDGLLCTAICNRARYKQQGEFLHAGFQSVFSDDDFSIRAYADEADGKCQIIRTDLTFLHRHCYHDKAVPEDATYRRENSRPAYEKGGALFTERNAALIARGFKTW